MGCPDGDVRMLERGGRLGLLDEAAFSLRVLGQLRRKHLDGDFTIIYEIDDAEGVTFIAMELIRGEKLSYA